MQIEFGFCPLHEVAAEIAPNIARHYLEMSEGDEYGTPNIDWDLMLEVSHEGQCFVVTMRDEQKLVGYGVYTLGGNPRYKHILEASSHGVFLEKEYRGRFGTALLRKADEFLSAIGVKETTYTLSDGRVGKLLERGGYTTKHRVWSIKYGQ